MRILSCLTAALLALPALAAEPMTGAEFEAYVTGKTLTFAEGGAAYGIEEYLPDRRVRWSFLDGRCKDGIWYEEADQICFVYEDTPDPQCWSFFLAPGGLRAMFENNPAATTLYEAAQSPDEMLCYGPDLGV